MTRFKCLDKYSMSKEQVGNRMGLSRKKNKYKKVKNKSKFKPKLRKKVNYKEYIISDKWRLFRKKYYEIFQRKCFICNSIYQITLHHISYKNLGKESFRDVVPLCWGCHNGVHNLVLNSKTKLLEAHIVYKKLKEMEC